MPPQITIIVPTYNERENIVPLIERIHASLKARDYETLFIDDDSPDGTSAVVESMTSDYPVRLIMRQAERGLASAVIRGIGEARGAIVGAINADLQHPPEVLREMAESIDRGADLTVASRYIKGGGCRDWALSRRIISRISTALTRLWVPPARTVKDPLSGCYMFKKAVTAGIPLKTAGYKILLEVLMKGRYRNPVEVPYVFVPRRKGRSKLGPLQSLQFLAQLVRFAFTSPESTRFLKFCAVGALGTLINTGILWLLTERLGFYYLLSSVFSIEAAIISNFLLNDRFTFADRRRENSSPFWIRMLKYNLVSLSGLVINMGVLWLLTSAAGIYYLFSNLAGIAAATLWRFTVNSHWTWKAPKQPPDDRAGSKASG